ncbi:MAG TPA: hypothetical protein PLE77_10630 [Kiritimatiellia bacterium]|nr:hypothetical protein [Kiritimatiellia bacterium]
MQTAPPLGAGSQPQKGLIIAGWVCVGVGFLTFWMCGVGGIFFVASLIISIILLSKGVVGNGIGMLLASLLGPLICFGMMMLLGVGLAASEAAGNGMPLFPMPPK